MKRTVRFVLLLVIVGLAASVAFAQDDKLSGKWYGDRYRAKFAKTGSSYEGLWQGVEMTNINFDGKNVRWSYSHDVSGLDEKGTVHGDCQAKIVVDELVGKCSLRYTLPSQSWTDSKTFTLEKQ